MNMLGVIARGLTGLFVEDGTLALQIVAVVILAGISASLMPDLPLVTGGILLLGCLGALFANVARAGRR